MNDDCGNFCVACGARLPSDATYCPECGHSVDGSDNPYLNARNVQMAPETLGNTYIFILIYAVVAILFGVGMVAMGTMVDQAFWDEFISSLPPEMAEAYAAISLADFQKTATFGGVMFLLSGAFAGVTGYLVNKRREWMVALITCCISAILSYELIITLVIGLYMAYRIYWSKNCFQD